MTFLADFSILDTISCAWLPSQGGSSRQDMGAEPHRPPNEVRLGKHKR